MTLTPEQNEILDLRDQVYDLKKQVSYLRGKLRGRGDMVMPSDWNLFPSEFEIIASLVTAPDGYRSMEDLLARACKVGSGSCAVRQHMSRLRKKLSRYNPQIKATAGGYQIDEASRSLIASAIHEAGREFS